MLLICRWFATRRRSTNYAFSTEQTRVRTTRRRRIAISFACFTNSASTRKTFMTNYAQLCVRHLSSASIGSSSRELRWSVKPHHSKTIFVAVFLHGVVYIFVGASASVQHSHHSDRTREHGVGREGEEGERKCQQGTTSGYQGSYNSQAASKAQERHACFGKSQEKEVMGLTFGVVMCIW